MLEWGAIPFFRASSQPRDQTQVSRIAGGFFTIRATREALSDIIRCLIASDICSGNVKSKRLRCHLAADSAGRMTASVL